MKCRSKENKALWQGTKQEFDDASSASTGSDLMKTLDLTRLARPQKGTSATAYEAQTYEQFAEQVEKQNPDVVFDKEMMDNTFTWAVETKVGSKAITFRREKDRMMQRVRCLAD